MLIDLKATLFKRNEDQEKAALLELKELIDFKDFKSALQSCLTDFIKNHGKVFKLPATLMQDVELLAQLSKFVTINDLYSSWLIPSLHKDLHIKIAMALDCKVGTEADENGKQHGDCLEDSMDHLDSQGSEAQPGVSNDTGGDGDLGEGGHVMDT
ncbi:hypothetical protein BD769DRAFT_1387887 [Suillus cothurnatus]|nr:hypothetical protein BD769DRAFT_1387887 [Suillus cothurnatus]